MGGGSSTEQDPYVFSCEVKDISKNRESSLDWIGTNLKVAKSTTFEKDFKDAGTIGTGFLGRVRIVLHQKSGKYFVIKSVAKADVLKSKMLPQLSNERKVLEQLVCNFTVKFFGSIKSKDHVHFVMEYIPGGELFKLLNERKRLSLSATKFYAVELLVCVEYLHNNGVIYRDLKPENILLDAQGHIKLVDFGFAKHIEDNERCYTSLGTPQYLSPEQLNGKGKSGYLKDVDLWAYACLIFELQTGKTPFAKGTKDTHFEVYTRIIQGKISWPRKFDSTLKDLLIKMLDPNYSNRLVSIDKIKEHKWFSGVDWDVVENRELIPPKTPVIRKVGDRSNYDEYPNNDQVTQSLSKTEDREFDEF